MSQDYANKLYDEYTAQRVRLDDASLEVAGRYDRAFLAISTGSLALSVAFVDKIASTIQPWTFCLLVFGWILLLAAVILQLLALSASHNATREQITILDQQYEHYFSAKDPEDAVRGGWEEPLNKFNSRVGIFNTFAQVTLILGVLFVLAFSAINIYYKKGENNEQKSKNTLKNDNQRCGRQGDVYTPNKQKTPTASTKEK